MLMGRENTTLHSLVSAVSPFPCPSPCCFPSALLQLLRDTDKALSILRARSLLVRLIQSLPTPAIPAAGGPHGLLNITRLLAAQDLAKGIAPASFGSISRGGGNDADQSVGSQAVDQRADPVVSKRTSKLGSGRDSKLADTPSPEDSLLKVCTVRARSNSVWGHCSRTSTNNSAPITIVRSLLSCRTRMY